MDQFRKQRLDKRRERTEDARYLLTVWWPAPSEKETYYDVAAIIDTTDTSINVWRENGERLLVSGVPFKLVDRTKLFEEEE